MAPREGLFEEMRLTMAKKIMVTNQELNALLMERLKELPVCKNVLSVVIFQAAPMAGHHTNWSAAFTMDGAPLVPAIAEQIAREMGSEFHLLSD
jgi:hypothetical protein